MAVFTKNNKNRPAVGDFLFRRPAPSVERRQIQALFSTVPAFGLESGCPRNVGFWPWLFCVLGLGLKRCALNSTSDSSVSL